MIWINSLAIIALAVMVIMQRREIDALHKRYQTAQDRQIKLQDADMKLAERTLDLANAHRRLEQAYKLLQGSTASALNIFEQQILRGAREDVEALQDEQDDVEEEA